MASNTGGKINGMEKHWFAPQSGRLLSIERQEESAEAEQARYQADIFKTVLQLVAVVCVALGAAYVFAFTQTNAWPPLVIGLEFFIVSAFSAAALRLLNSVNFKLLVRLWLALATWLVFSFGLLQSGEFVLVMAMGGSVVIGLAVFLEPTRISYQWALVNIGSYVLVLLCHNFLTLPASELGVLHNLVLDGTPIAVLIILTELGRVTTQHFKHSLIQSEARRKEIELQERQLRVLAAEAQAARDKAEQSDHVKSAFLASMSHELRTPLNAIINFSKFVADGDMGPVNQTQHEMLDEVVSSSRHLLSLINDVLDMSKIEAGSLMLFVEADVDVSQIVNSAVTSSTALLMKKPIEMQVHIEDRLPTVCADRQRILQVLLNLLSNACKFTEKGFIDVRVYGENDKIVIAVQDTGPGINRDEQPLVFEAFRQTKAGLRSMGGTGLGMPISKNLVEAHDGKLWLESEPGKGSTFFVSLPVKSTKLVPTV